MAKLELDLDFNEYQFDEATPFGCLMVRIVDENNTIMGDAMEDNLVVFLNFKRLGQQEDQLDQSQKLKMASILLDQGYSRNFQRCFKAVECTGGQIEAAKDLLSKITITENQYY